MEMQIDDRRDTTHDAWAWVGDDTLSERVTEAVRRWLDGMDDAIARASSEREK